MSEPMTPVFVTAFLKTCYDSGLSKEAAAALLQQESVDHAKYNRPAFAAGYDATTEGRLRPMLSADGTLTKAAFRMPRSLRKVWLGAKLMGSGIKDPIVGGVKRVAGAAEQVFNPNNTESWLRKHPALMLGGTSAAVGGGSLALGHHLWAGDAAMRDNADPYLPPGAYDPAAEKGRYEDSLYNVYGPSIAAHNQQYFSSRKARDELQQAIAENRTTPGGGEYKRLQDLNREYDTASKKREEYLHGLEQNQARNEELQKNIAQQKADLESKRTSMWSAPSRWYTNLTGGDYNAGIDNQVQQLQDRASRANRESQLAAGRHQLLTDGYVRRRATSQPSSDQLQQKFFPSW